MQTKSATFDEPTHFAAGYSYWLRHDFRLDAESGILAQRWAALPLLISRPSFPSDDARSWKTGAQGTVGSEFLYSVGNDADTLLAKGRAMMMLIGAATCLLVYAWSKELFGTTGALISATLAAFCPTELANAPLVTSDATLALCMSAAVWCVWRMLGEVSVGRVLIASAAVAATVLAKISGALVFVMIIAMLLVRLFRRRTHSLQLIVAVLAIAAITWIAVWTAYDFRFAAASDQAAPAFVNAWPRLLQQHGLATFVTRFARDHRLLPEAYLYGAAYVHANAQLRPAFLDGNWSVVGFRDFFLRSFFYKTPLPLLCLAALAVGSTVLVSRGYFGRNGITSARVTTVFFNATPVWTLLLIYGAFALTARLNIGHRHILPIYPPLLVACGATAIYFRHPRLRIAMAGILVLVVWHAAEAVAAWPNYLAYFNELAGGPRRAYMHLVDSSLDWGQDLPALHKQIDEFQRRTRDSRPIYLAYFGTAHPQYYGIDAVNLPATFGATDVPLTQLIGGLYCISATALQQVYSDTMGPWCRRYEELYQGLRPDALRFETQINQVPRFPVSAEERAGLALFNQLRFARLCAALRHRVPMGNAGYSILLFVLSDADLHQALDGPPVELEPDVQVAGLH